VPRVALISNLPQDQVDIVFSYAPAGFETASLPSRASEEEKVAFLKDADFLILFGARPSEAMLRAAPKLRHVQLLSAGYEGIDLALTDALGIPVSNNGGATWAYTPAANADGVDPAVTHIRVRPQGAMAGASGGSPWFEIRFRVRVQ